MDVAHAFLTQSEVPEKSVILAIDEPDASLHVSACFDQFEKLKEIANHGHQVILTTHWYGFLPIVSDGLAHSMGVDDNGDVREVETFSLYGYPENIKHEQKRTRNDLPRDVHLKSLNDLVQSIVASVIRKEPYNWIICEGLSDKIYLDAYLSHIVAKRKLRILPLAGRESVRRIFEHLRLPLIDKSIGAKGRIMCIIDTDKQSMEAPSDGKEKVIELRRLWVNHDKNEVELLRSNDNKWAPETNIEDCLDSAIFVKTLQEYSADYPFLKKIVNRDETSIGRYAFEIDLLRSERDNLDKQFFNVGDNKVRFAKSYVSVLVEQNTQKKESLTWVDGLENFFTR